MFFMQVCWSNEDKVNVKQQEALQNKYSLVVTFVFVLIQDECFSIDVGLFR